jgi:NodT family efflux transporter outer membrane factor (OMF) lipoprotein
LSLRKRLLSTRVLAGVLVLALGGCAVGPDYSEPASDLAKFQSADAVSSRAATTPAPQIDRWWEGFNDPEMTRIVRRALDQNLDLAAALGRVEQARAAAHEAGAQLLPSVDLSAQARRQRQSLESPTGAIAHHLPGYDRNQSLYDVGAAASWEIDLFGGLSRAAEAASAEAQAAEAARLGTRISVAADAADAYLRIRGDQARLAVANDQVATDAHLLDLVQRRFAKGLSTDREVAQAEALLAGARASLQPLRIDLEGQLNRLDVLMGMQPGSYAATLTEQASIPSPPAITGATPTDLLRRRPDIIAAERRLAASNARIGAAIADYYPKFSLSALLGFESSKTGDLLRATTFQPQGVLGMRWRLFDFGKVDAEVDAAKGAEAEDLARYRQSVLHAAEDVENAFTALVQLEANVEERKREVAALRRARDLSQSAYQTGVIPLTDVLDANRQLLSAEDDLVHAEADVSRSAVSAFRALGGGWSSDVTELSEVANVRDN